MADPADDTANPFDKIAPRPLAEAAPTAAAPTPVSAAPAANDDDADNPFDKIAPRPLAEGSSAPPTSSAGGALLRGAAESAIPTATGMVGMGAGATIGAALGAPFMGVGAVPGAVIGGVVGGLGGMLLGSTAGQIAQDWAVTKLPEETQKGIAEQRKADEETHPNMRFVGGLLPVAVTMNPGAVGRKVLPEGATALTRILANPVTARMIGGGAFGGLEMGQEMFHSEPPDWAKIGMATGFGFFFNKPTKIGDSLLRLGERPTQSLLRIRPEVAEPPVPTVAEAGDLKVLGPGITEDVFMGTHEQSLEAETSTRQTAQTEHAALHAPTPPEVQATARKLEPELFGQWDHLQAQREEIRNWLDEHTNPPDEHVSEASGRVEEIEKQLEEHVAGQKGYSGGPEARRLRAQLRDAQAQRDLLLTRRSNAIEGTIQETPEASAARKHMMDIDYQMRDLSDEVRAAYRRAAEHSGTETVPAPPQAEAAPSAPAAALPPEAMQAATGEPAPAPLKTVAEQKLSIAADVTRKLVAAGRPQAEATAAGHLYANQIATRAARFKGKRGTAEELYRAEGAEIRGEGTPPPGVEPTSTPPTEAAPAPSKPPEGIPENSTLLGKNQEGEDVWLRSDGTRASLGKDGRLRQEMTGTSTEEGKAYGAKTPPRLQVVEEAPAKPPEAPSEPVPAVAALPKGFEDWVPGAKVKVGPLANMTVLTADDGKFTLSNPRGQVFSFEPPAKVGKEKTGLEMLEHLVEIKGATAPPQPVAEMAQPKPTPESPKPAGPAHSFEDAVKTEQERLKEQPNKKRRKIKDRNEEARFDAFQKEAGTELRDIMAEQPDVDRKFFEDLYKTYRREPGETPAAALWRAIDERAQEIEKNAPIANDAQMAHDLRVLNEHFESESRRGAPGTFLDSDMFGKFERTLPAGPRSTFGGLELEREFSQTAPSGGGAGEGRGTAPGEGGRSAQAGELPADGGAPRGKGNAIPPDQEFSQGHLGKIKIQGGQRSVITLMKDANASTAIHEFGHDFFEQLDRDSRHADAPDDLKADAATIRKWAGAKESGPLSVKAHEKVARGFERYMREGIAPSKELAGVFQQFKNWLLSIYQSVKELRAPISDDIRQVFDRMLAEEPNHTVIAPEVEQGPMISAIHEADAAHTEPAQAEPVADRVAAERASIVKEPPPQVRNEIETAIKKDDAEQAAQPGGENAVGAERPAEVDAGGGESGAKPGSGGVGEGSGPVGGGGGEASTEGGAVSGSEQRRSTGPSAEPPVAPRPAPILADVSPFLDKAGNIRLENLTTDEQVRQAIHDAADRNDDLIGARNGVVTDGMVMDMARAIGMEGAEALVKKWVIGKAYSAGEVMAIRQLAVQSSTEVSRLSKLAAAGTDEDVRAFMQEVVHHDMIVKTLSGATAEAGRALRAFQDITGGAGRGVDPILRDSTGMTLFQAKRLAKLTSVMDTPEQVSRQMQAMNKRSAGRMVLEYFINNLISGPATHTTYTIGNTLLSLEKVGLETPVAALIGHVRSAMGREGETVRMGEFAAGLKGGLQGITPAMKAGMDALRTGVTTMLPGESLRTRTTMPFEPGRDLVQPAILDEAATFSDVMGSTFGIIRGLRDGFVTNAALLKAGGEAGAPLIHGNFSQLGAIPNIAVRGATVLPVGDVVRLPSRAIAGIHSFFRSVNYSIEKAQGAHRIAVNEGHTGEALDARIGDLWQNPSETQMESYRHEATEMTLMGQGSAFTRKLSNLLNTDVKLPVLGAVPILKFIDPFVHISSNVIDQAIIQRTPVGLLSSELRADLMGKNGTVAQDKAQARMLVGSALAVTVGGLAAQGFITGSAPSDPKEAALWRSVYQDHSVRIGDTWYSFGRLGPLGMLMGISADMYDVAHSAEKGDFVHAASHLQHAFTQNVLDESFMRGPSDLIRAVEDPGRYGDAYIRNFLASFVPYSVGLNQVNRAIDPYTRQARTVVDAMKSKVPGLSQELLPRRDMWGEMLPSRDALVSPAITAIFMQKRATDPVNVEMVRLGMGPAPPERKILNQQLTDQQYDYYSMIAGRMAKGRIESMVRSPEWQNVPDGQKRDLISLQIKNSRESARQAIMARDPTIAVRAAQAKRDKLNAKAE